jgi:E3 ubiquitin-protein ligase CHFR
MDNMAEQFDCGICYQIMHQAVSLIPCLHNYCGGCFSDWMKRSKDCPNCRKAVLMVNKNAQLNSTIESFLKINPDKKREEWDIEDVEKKNIFKNEVVR